VGAEISNKYPYMTNFENHNIVRHVLIKFHVVKAPKPQYRVLRMMPCAMLSYLLLHSIIRAGHENSRCI
jgi:hypothetical protein